MGIQADLAQETRRILELRTEMEGRILQLIHRYALTLPLPDLVKSCYLLGIHERSHYSEPVKLLRELLQERSNAAISVTFQDSQRTYLLKHPTYLSGGFSIQSPGELPLYGRDILVNGVLEAAFGFTQKLVLVTRDDVYNFFKAGCLRKDKQFVSLREGEKFFKHFRTPASSGSDAVPIGDYFKKVEIEITRAVRVFYMAKLKAEWDQEYAKLGIRFNDILR